jgi:hypothetical protein
VLGLAAVCTWAALGTITALDRTGDFTRAAIPGQATVTVTDPGTMVVSYEGTAPVARFADSTATGRNATRWTTPADATITVPAAAPSWQRLGLTVTGPDGAVVPVRAAPSGFRHDAGPARLGQAVASFEAATGTYVVSATAAPDAGANLAVGDDVGGEIATSTLVAAAIASVSLLGAGALALATHRARSRGAAPGGKR